MYKSFRVKNFRCFKDLQINDLGRVNLIAGKNNTGKTALLEAMYLHTGNRDVKTLLRTDRAAHSLFARDSVSRDPDLVSADIGGWPIVFRDFNIADEIDLTADTVPMQQSLFGLNETTSVKLSVKSSESEDYVVALDHFNVEDFDLLKSAAILEIDAEYDRQPTLLLYVQGKVRASRLRNSSLYSSEFVFAMERISSRRLASLYSRVRQSNRKIWFIETLRVVEPRISDVDLLFVDGRLVLSADIGLSQLLPFTSLGDGTNRFASVILAMSNLAHGVIFVDEIEIGLHHTIQQEAWKTIGDLAQELNVQVFATTHSLEFVQAAYDAFSEGNRLDQFRYHRLDHHPEFGDIEVVTYNESGIEAAMTTNWEIRG
ncbi:MAG: AAA family ATPase [Chloroflexi bacterium]|nr:AAA family ATPase [Chloroflexota bacterium]